MHLCGNSEILSFKPLASNGWDQKLNSQTWPINRGWSNWIMGTKTNIAFVYTLFSLLLHFLLQREVTIEFSKGKCFTPNQCCRHIIYNILKLSKHLCTTCNLKFIKFICHLKPWCSQHTRRSSGAFQFIPNFTTHYLRSSEVIPIITSHL